VGAVVIVTLETHVKCPSCSHPIRFIGVATIRVNKRSARTVDGIILGAFEDWRCPGCREVIPRDMPMDREPYRVADKDAVKVAAYRKRRWGIEDGGAIVERVRSETAATRDAG
jgi:hypothetical protein